MLDLEGTIQVNESLQEIYMVVSTASQGEGSSVKSDVS